MKSNIETETWCTAVDVVREEFASLKDPFLGKVGTLLTDIRRLKTNLFDLTSSVAGEAVCAICHGACCDTGKYHFTVVDLLLYFFDGKKLFTPNFSSKRCPYLGNSGCLMEPGYRPFNCITFHCEQLEPLLTCTDVKEFYDVERKLRIQYNTIEELFVNKFSYGLLANYERDYLKDGTILFGGGFDPKFCGGYNVNQL